MLRRNHTYSRIGKKVLVLYTCLKKRTSDSSYLSTLIWFQKSEKLESSIFKYIYTIPQGLRMFCRWFVGLLRAKSLFYLCRWNHVACRWFIVCLEHPRLAMARGQRAVIDSFRGHWVLTLDSGTDIRGSGRTSAGAWGRTRVVGRRVTCITSTRLPLESHVIEIERGFRRVTNRLVKRVPTRSRLEQLDLLTIIIRLIGSLTLLIYWSAMQKISLKISPY